MKFIKKFILLVFLKDGEKLDAVAHLAEVVEVGLEPSVLTKFEAVGRLQAKKYFKFDFASVRSDGLKQVSLKFTSTENDLGAHSPIWTLVGELFTTRR